MPFFGTKIIMWMLLTSFLWVTAIYPTIALGVLAALINKKIPYFYENIRCKVGLMFVLLVSIYGISDANTFRDTNYLVFAPAVSISIVLLLAVRGNASIVGVLAGCISYPLYLNHWIGIVIANKLLESFEINLPSLHVAMFVSINLFLTACLYLLIEIRVLLLRDSLYNENRGVIAIYIAYGLMVSGLLFGLFMHTI
jgi:peptidoglycan/LPS O-acetylase OafA/YrhL